MRIPANSLRRRAIGAPGHMRAAMRGCRVHASAWRVPADSAPTHEDSRGAGAMREAPPTHRLKPKSQEGIQRRLVARASGLETPVGAARSDESAIFYRLCVRAW